jgi:glucosylceramidase
VACIVLPLAACSSAPGLVEAYSTTGTKSALLTRESDIPLNIGAGAGDVDVIVDAGRELQKIDGFGGAMTHSAATVLLEQTPELRRQILEQLYSTDDGAGFGLVRLPIGTSDYAGLIDGEAVHYTLDDMPEGKTDPDLTHFSLENDEKSVIPVLQEALEINPELTIIGSPWSAPAWMKTTDSLYSGSLLPEYEDVYADYLVAFVAAYREHGIDIDYLTIENEPLVASRDYPVMEMGEFQQLSIIEKLGPKLAAAGLGEVKVLAYDFNYSDAWSSTAVGFVDTILGDPEASQYTAGIAFHGYENEGIDTFGQGFQYVHDEYPDKKSLVTEITEGTWSRDFASNFSYSLVNIVLGPLNYWSTGAVYWNTVLYADGTPSKGGAGTSLGLISVTDEGTYEKSSAYYAMAQFSEFLGTSSGGDARVVYSESSSPEIYAAAIKRPDGRLLIVVHNASSAFAESVNVIVGGSSFTADIAAHSATTFLY